MRFINKLILCLFTLYVITSCTGQALNKINLNEITPWCIVNFDSLERSPTERIEMLKSMGFTSYGYNWDTKHLDEMQEEFELAKANQIEIVSVFLWLNAKRDSIGKLSPANKRMLSILKDVDTKPTLWLSFSNNYFDKLSQDQAMKVAIDYISYIKKEADGVGCKLALYNHHGWFGNPFNQLEIIKQMPQDSLTMVYNFHHAHDYLDEFSAIASHIVPHLSYVNLNGMKEDGPKILTIGEGDYEQEMISILLDEGYQGPWGILGHIKSEDVQKVLSRNIEGLKQL